MGFVEIPWARYTVSPNNAVSAATPPSNAWVVANNEYLSAYTDAPVPARRLARTRAARSSISSAPI
jgi:hypothetical protein